MTGLTTALKALHPAILAELRAVVGEGGLVTAPEQLRTYESDGLTSYRMPPSAVVLPTTTEQVQGIVRVCHREGIPFVSRGSGTGLSGGSLPVEGGVVIGLARMNRILTVDLPNQRVVVQPGVINLAVTQRVAADGYYFAPDPSSQSVCTIGGNIAENSGGAHCLKYGFTTNHVIGMKVVLSDGELVELGGYTPGTPGYDLLGAFVGSEGTLGVATEITLRLVRQAAAVQMVVAAFESTDEAGGAVSDIIAAGILPSAIEMMDRFAIEAVEKAVHAGYPVGAGALLIVELDGRPTEVAELLTAVYDICSSHNPTHVRTATDAVERALIWKGRKAAFAAMGRISPDYYVQDGVVPRTALPKVLRQIDLLSEQFGLRVANVFHAGDGNLHPLVLYDAKIDGQTELAEELAGEILLACVQNGGSITGEHGIGVDKAKHMPKLFTNDDLATMNLLRCAFDPDGLSNPGKVFPTPRLCGERPGPWREHPLVAAGKAEIF